MYSQQYVYTRAFECLSINYAYTVAYIERWAEFSSKLHWNEEAKSLPGPALSRYTRRDSRPCGF